VLTIGTPADNPAADDVLVTSASITDPRVAAVRLTVATEGPFWATLRHRTAGGGIRSSMHLPVNNLFGPIEIYRTYFGAGEYVDVAVRSGSDAVVGTVQASVEIK
jgi:hypothetical protein